MKSVFRLLAVALMVLPVLSLYAWAQEPPETAPDPEIETRSVEAPDAAIASRINEIFEEIGSLSQVDVSVTAGVVTLSGETASAEAAARAETLALRVDGVVTVENAIERDVSVSNRLAPALSDAEDYVSNTFRFLPLLALSVGVFVLIAFLGWLVSRWDGLLRRITPNAFIAELAKTTLRAASIVIGAVAALSLLDATALMGAFLGAAGVIGLAVGFAVRDTIENYIASIMLSLRQPFRPNDHVVIDGKEGRVIRLTSRATILMTLDGNHLRIPNASVFKAVILNYTRNPQRRFDFLLGIDADDDPLAAIETGLAAIQGLDFVLDQPAPQAFIENVGDSNIVIFFAGWIDQSLADFGKSRSVALSAVKDALEEEGFALPEPIYRLRFDANAPPALKEADGAMISTSEAQPRPRKQRPARHIPAQQVDVRPDTDLVEKVEEERRDDAGSDLLATAAPQE